MKPSRIYPAEPPMKGETPVCRTERVGLDVNDDFEGIESYDTRIPMKNRGAINIIWRLKR